MWFMRLSQVSEAESDNPLRTPAIEVFERTVCVSMCLHHGYLHMLYASQAENVHKVYDTIASHWNHTTGA